MRIKSLTAKNYRTLVDFEINFSNNFCTISGRNNAGKSCVIRLLSILFRNGQRYPWRQASSSVDYKDDKTQWIKDSSPIQLGYTLEITKDEDPALISFIEKISRKVITDSAALLQLTLTTAENGDTFFGASVNGESVDEEAKEIHKRIKDSNLLFLYNSTTRSEDFIYGGGRRRMFYEFVMSPEEKKELDAAGKHVERRLRRFAKEHTAGLSTILGRLAEKYDVEVSPLEGYSSHEMPLGINLKDKNVEVPLNDWGSGTQNRTSILMAILQANRIKTAGNPDEKITPIVVVEEPESFLHPSAQAEFGKMLRNLSGELGIQIIATTHSPHMLNQQNASSNILLSREVKRSKLFETRIIETSGESWMAPFADHLGIGKIDFDCLKPLFAVAKSKVLLVEGPIDKEYFSFLQNNSLACEKLNPDIEIVPYGGKDTLKNTLLVQFVLKKFDSVFVTYDLDAAAECKPALIRVDLEELKDFCSLGVNQPGKNCIEGLLPERTLSAVHAIHSTLIMKLGSTDNKERRRAKDELKKHYLNEFISKIDYSKDELRELSKAIRTINTKFAG